MPNLLKIINYTWVNIMVVQLVILLPPSLISGSILSSGLGSPGSSYWTCECACAFCTHVHFRVYSLHEPSVSLGSCDPVIPGSSVTVIMWIECSCDPRIQCYWDPVFLWSCESRVPVIPGSTVTRIMFLQKLGELTTLTVAVCKSVGLCIL